MGVEDVCVCWWVFRFEFVLFVKVGEFGGGVKCC